MWKTLPTLYVRLRYEDNSYTAATNCRSACNLNTSGLVATVTRIGGIRLSTAPRDS
jgi:hypothetical protein